MKIWVIADLHLSVSCPEKDMGIFGPAWQGYMKKIAHNWNEMVEDDDLVLIPGDISWAMRPEQAKIDLEWIDALPGMKVMIRGNHDYWWSSLSKVKAVLPPSIQVIQNTAINWNGFAISGTRLWDSEEYSFAKLVGMPPGEGEPREEDQKIFEREMGRLEMALKALDQKARTRIVMTHYPPIGADLEDSRASKLFERYHVNMVVFGHLHSVDPAKETFGKKNDVEYLLTSCDYLNFRPLQIA